MLNRPLMLMARPGALVVGLATWSAGGPARATVPPPPEQTHVDLVIDTSEVPATIASRLDARLYDRLEDNLREHGFVVIEGNVDATIEVQVALVDVELRIYEISVNLLRDGAREVVIDAHECPACTEGGVVEETVELLPSVTSLLPPPEPELAPALHDTESEIDPEAKPSDVAAAPGRKRGLGPLGIVGAVVSGAGAAAAASGGLMLELLSPDDYYSERPTQREVAFGLIVGGGTAVLLGVSALVVDLEVLQRKQEERGLDVSLGMVPSGGGLFVRGRF
jgi:hypothetical protein